MKSKKALDGKGFLIQGSILAIAGVITKVIGAIYRFPLINILGDTGMGYYGVAFQIYTVALTLTSYSLPLAVSKLITARVATREYRNADRVFNASMLFAILSGGLAAAVIFFGADFIASKLMFVPGSVLALRVLAPCVLIVSLLGVLRGFFQGIGSMIPTAISQVIEQIINAVLSIAGAYFLLKNVAGSASTELKKASYAAAGGTIGTVGGALSALVFLALIFLAYNKIFKRHVMRDYGHVQEPYKDLFKILLLTIAPIILSTTVSNLCGVLDQGLFGLIMSSQGFKESEYTAYLGIMVGKYDTLINVPVAISWALASSLIPSLVASVELGETKQVHTKIRTITRFTMMIAIPCAVGFIFLARPILDLLFFTENNGEAAWMLRMGGISVVFFCLSTITNAVLQGLDKMMLPVKNAAIALGIHVVSVVIMLAFFKWGIYALVIGNIIFSGSICILNFHDLRMVSGYYQEQRHTFVIPGICSVVMGIAALLVQMLLNLFTMSRITVIISILIAMITYGGMLLFVNTKYAERRRRE